MTLIPKAIKVSTQVLTNILAISVSIEKLPETRNKHPQAIPLDPHGKKKKIVLQTTQALSDFKLLFQKL